MVETTGTRRSSLRGRVLSWFAVVFVALLVLTAVLVRSGVRESLTDQLTADLVDKAGLIALTLRGENDVQTIISRQADLLGVRVTVIEGDGTVIADSESDPSVMNDHSDRPEVIAALAGDVGTSTRFSSTTSESRRYVALPPDNGKIVRLSVTEKSVSDELAALTGRIITAAASVGVVGSLAVAFAASRIARPIAALTDTADQIAGGRLDIVPDRSSIVELDRLGQAIGGMASDLGRRFREAEEERRTLETVLGALPEGVILVESDGGLSYANPAATALLGPIPERLGALAPAALQRIVRRARESGNVETVDVEVGSPTRMVSAVATRFHDDWARVLLVAADNTEQHRIEAMRRDFVADASHELKTPIAAILASAEALEIALDRDLERARQFSGQVETSAHRLARIVEDLLDLSRLESADTSTGSCRLDAVASEEIERLRGQARAAKVSLDSSFEPATVAGSPSDWALAVRNLCENAITYTNAGGDVMVAIRSRASTIELTVSDTGSGIPTRALGRVFERFYRVDAARSRETGGTGLGLAIVRHVAERHGGAVSVTSELGVGSTFRIVVPAVLSAQEVPHNDS